MFNKKEYMKKYRQKNKEILLKYRKQYYKKYKEVELKQGKEYYQGHKEEKLKHVKKYRQEHRKERNEYLRNKRKIDPRYNLNRRISSLIKYSLNNNKNGCSWESLVGYTLDDLKKKLEFTIPKGYTWEDYKAGKLQIDHIIPVSVFNFTRPEHSDFKRCWALSNLRLLPARENLSKCNHLDKPFQPTLMI